MPTSTQTLDKSHNVIRGGIEGRNRLRILARVMWPSTLSLLQRAGFKNVINVTGGFDAWQQAGLPSVSSKPVVV